MKERITKLIKEAQERFIYAEEQARYLIDNEVIVPPCKVDDSIFRVGNTKIWEWLIKHTEIYADEIVFIDDSGNVFTEDDIGKTVFLTREEAERALKGGVQG
jgi:hypothetical protein